MRKRADMAEAKRIGLVLCREANAELAAVAGVEEAGGWLNFPRDTLDEVKLAVVEACLNALEYGDGEVEVEFVAHPGRSPRLEVSVIDHGPGFDPQAVGRPRLEGKLHAARKRGWGLELIRRLMDRVDIDSRPGHTRVHMVKARGGV